MYYYICDKIKIAHTLASKIESLLVQHAQCTYLEWSSANERSPNTTRPGHPCQWPPTLNQITPRIVLLVTRPIGPLLARHGVTSPAPVPPPGAARPGISGSTGRLLSLRQEHKEACRCRQRFGVRGALAAKLRALHIGSILPLHFGRSAAQPQGVWSHSASFRVVFWTSLAEYWRIAHFRVWVSIEGRVCFSRRVGGWS